MASIAFVLAEGFEDQEFATPHTSLLEEGHDVEVVGTDAGQEMTGKRGEITVTADVGIDDVDPSDYDALVIPGGWSPDRLRTDPRVVDFVRRMVDRDVPVAAICHAGSLLIEADRVRGRTMTSYPSIRTDLVNAGANWVDEEVVRDGALITSRRPDDLPAFTTAIGEALGTPVVRP